MNFKFDSLHEVEMIDWVYNQMVVQNFAVAFDNWHYYLDREPMSLAFVPVDR